MDWLVDPFSLGFVQRALVAGLLVAVTTSVVGTWVVLRGLTFMGDALAHGIVPGLALATLLSFPLGIGALLAALVMVAGVEVVRRGSRLAEDVGIGLLFVGMLALGAIIASRSPTFAGDLTALLFGVVLGVGAGDLWLAAAAAAVALAATALLYRPFLALAFSARKAATLGLHPDRTHWVLLALVVLAVIAAFRAVGALLVFAFLVAPPATAALIVRRVPTMMAVATAVGAVAVVTGLLVSYHLDTAASATMAATAVVEFFLVLSVRELGRRAGTRARTAPAGTG